MDYRALCRGYKTIHVFKKVNRDIGNDRKRNNKHAYKNVSMSNTEGETMCINLDSSIKKEEPSDVSMSNTEDETMFINLDLSIKQEEPTVVFLSDTEGETTCIKQEESSDDEDFPMIDQPQPQPYWPDEPDAPSYVYILVSLEKIIDGTVKVPLEQVPRVAANKAVLAIQKILETDKGDGIILTLSQRLRTNELILKMTKLRSQGFLVNNTMREKIGDIDDLPLEMLWWLHCSHLVLFSTYLYMTRNRQGHHRMLKNRLVSLICQPKERHLKEFDNEDIYYDDNVLLRITKDLMTDILVTAYLQTDAQRLCSRFLNSITPAYMRKVTSPATIPPINFLRLMCDDPVLPTEDNIFQLCIDMFNTMFTMDPTSDLATAFAKQYQDEWTFKTTPVHTTELFADMCKCLGVNQVKEMLYTIFLEYEHWYFLMIFVSTFLVTTEGAPQAVIVLIDDLLEGAVERSNSGILAASFLMMRQWIREVPRTKLGIIDFTRYPYWFEKSFSGKMTKRNARFLLKTLTKWIPFELPFYLHIHSRKLPPVPRKCQDLLINFKRLAKRRLIELKFDVFPSIMGKYSCQCDLDLVERHFNEYGVILPSLLSASVIHRAHYIKYFLPRLLAGNYGKIVAALLALGKIPKHLRPKEL